MALERSSHSEFGALLRHWRGNRHLSQMELAMEAGISPRHLSFLETGRSRPSRGMVQRLASVLEVPLRECNDLLVAAGHAPSYDRADLQDAGMAMYRQAVQWTLDKHEPYPALVLDRHWNIVIQNRASQGFLLAILPADPLQRHSNAMELLFSSEGLQPHVANWEEVASAMLARIYREHSHSPGDEFLAGLYERLAGSETAPADWRGIAARTDPGPVLPLVLVTEDARVSLFSTITTFGTPHDVTLQELRIECFFPADETTRRLFESLAEREQT